jgi:ABC-type transport system substrate-binding protein
MATKIKLTFIVALTIVIALPGISAPVFAQNVEDTFVPMSLIAKNCSYGGLIKSIVANDPSTVTFDLCRPDPAFLPKLAMSPFAIYQKDWINATSGATNRTAEGLEMPVGTGPYKISGWDRGSSLTFVSNPDYWGAAPETDSLIFTWSSDPAERLLALQNNTIDGYDEVAPEDYGVIEADPNLQLITRSLLNTFYIGLNNTISPFQDLRVRRAIAMGINRQLILDSFYPPQSEVATHFTPCGIPNGCVGTTWYSFDPVAGRALLAAAGYPNGFNMKLYYRDVPRAYLPHVSQVAQNIKSQLLTNLGIKATIVVMESGTFIEEVSAGHLGFYLLGWAVDYPHASNFLDYHFGAGNRQFGNPFPDIYNNLNAALQFADPLLAKPYYTAANNNIRKLVPMVPVAHSASAVAYRADVTNPQASPMAAEFFAVSDPGGRSTFKWMQGSEPVSLFCADEFDSSSSRACGQVMETLYAYSNNGSTVEPALAESCTPNEDLMTWTCTLRQNVKFHNNSILDANDVVATFTMGLDVTSRTHKGNSNAWAYYDFIFGLMNKQTAIRSDGLYDGWVLESGETTSKGGALNSAAPSLYLGDNAQRKQFRAVLSFHTKSLPDSAVITRVVLRLKRQAAAGGGNPAAIFRGFMVDIRKGFFGPAAGLQVSDFQAAAHRSYGPFNPALINGWYTIDLSPAKAYINKLATSAGVTQVRLRFRLDDNNNSVANYLSLYSGNAAAATRPQLILEYYVP